MSGRRAGLINGRGWDNTGSDGAFMMMRRDSARDSAARRLPSERCLPASRQENIAGTSGWGGIRTHGRVSPTPVFKTGALNHSATHPYAAVTDSKAQPQVRKPAKKIGDPTGCQ